MTGFFHQPIAWYKHEQTAQVLNAIEDLGFIAGGWARWELLSDAPEPSDIDVFCLHPSFAIAFQIQENLKRIGYQYQHYLHTADVYRHPNYGHTVQVIRPNVGLELAGSPEEVLGRFDFTVNQFALTNSAQHGRMVYEGADSRDHHFLKRLVFVNISSPLSLLNRTIKYVQKGYELPPTEAAKLFLAYEKTDDHYRSHVTELSFMEPEVALQYGVIEDFFGPDIIVGDDDHPF